MIIDHVLAACGGIVGGVAYQAVKHWWQHRRALAMMGFVNFNQQMRWWETERAFRERCRRGVAGCVSVGTWSHAAGGTFRREP